MKILRIPAVFGSNFPFFEDLSNPWFFFRILKKISYRVGLIENNTLQILGLCQENLKSEKMMHKIYSPCF